MNPTINLTILAGQDGGLVIYESVNDEYGAPDSRLVFGGNLDEASKYLTSRMSGMLDENAKMPKTEPRQIEAPKIRRRKQEPQIDAVLDALEMVESEAA